MKALRRLVVWTLSAAVALLGTVAAAEDQPDSGRGDQRIGEAEPEREPDSGAHGDTDPPAGREASDATEHPRERARERFFHGLDRLAADDYEGAALEFERSIDAEPTLAARLNLANVYVVLGRCTAADNQATKLPALLAETSEPRWQAEAEALSRALSKCFAYVDLSVDPPNATALLDGQAVDPAEQLRVDPGEHRLKVEARGMRSEERQLEVARGATIRVEVELQPFENAGGSSKASGVPASRILAPKASGNSAIEDRSTQATSPSWPHWLSASVAVTGAVSTAVLWKLTDDRHAEYERRTKGFNQQLLDSNADREALLRERRSLDRLSQDVGQLKTALLTSAVVTTAAVAVVAWLWWPSEDTPQASTLPMIGGRF